MYIVDEGRSTGNDDGVCHSLSEWTDWSIWHLTSHCNVQVRTVVHWKRVQVHDVVGSSGTPVGDV